jgi:hypothetical protein
MGFAGRIKKEYQQGGITALDQFWAIYISVNIYIPKFQHNVRHTGHLSTPRVQRGLARVLSLPTPPTILNSTSAGVV